MVKKVPDEALHLNTFKGRANIHCIVHLMLLGCFPKFLYILLPDSCPRSDGQTPWLESELDQQL